MCESAQSSSRSSRASLDVTTVEMFTFPELDTVKSSSKFVQRVFRMQLLHGWCQGALNGIPELAGADASERNVQMQSLLNIISGHQCCGVASDRISRVTETSPAESAEHLGESAGFPIALGYDRIPRVLKALSA